MNYTVVKGDTLGIIASKILGSSSKWQDIWKANPQIIDPNRISVGQLLKIPGTTSLTKISATPFSNVTSSQSGNSIQKLMQDKNMLILLGVGILGLIYFLNKGKVK